jgi:regulator of sigma E protease
VLSQFLADFGSLAATLVAFFAALAVIVGVHEYGHYIVGRWCGIKADVFSLGFGPRFFSRRDRHGTLWQLAIIPLGGFVRFRGDKDAASAQAGDVPMTAQEARQTLAGAPLWARAATIAAGPMFNFVMAFVIFWAGIMVVGLSPDRAIVGTPFAMPRGEVLRAGDEIVAVAGIATPDLETFGKVASDVPPMADVVYQVRRDGVLMDLVADHPRPPRAGEVHLRSAAFDAGILVGDVILQIEGQKAYTFNQMRDVVVQSAGAPLKVVLWRPGQGEVTVTLSARSRDLPKPEGGFETRWMLGLTSSTLFEAQPRWAGPLEAAVLAAGQVGTVLEGTFSSLVHMARGDISTCNLSGPIGLADTMGQAARTGLESFVMMLAVVSLGVGFLNLLPVPVLDGGHLVFIAYEAVTRRKPNPRLLNVAVALGAVLLLGFILFSLGNDLTCV